MTTDTEVFRRWAESLENEHGWYAVSDLRDKLNEVTSKNVDTTEDDLTRLADFTQSYDDLDIILRKKSSSQRTRYFVEKDFEARIKDIKSKIPEYSHDVFDEVIRSGKSPSIVAAAIIYLTSKIHTKASSAKKFDVTPAGLSNVEDEVAEKLDCDLSDDYASKEELCEMIADNLDLSSDIDINGYFTSEQLRFVLDEINE